MRSPTASWRSGRLLVVMTMALAACKSGAADCPQNLPASCPAQPPSYRQTVAAVIARECTGCHAPDALQSDRDLSTYAGLYANRGAVLDQVYACNMPPAGSPSLDTADRVLLLTWLVCGSPNN